MTSTPALPLWLQDVTGKKACAWADEHSGATIAHFKKDPRLTALTEDFLQILDAQDKLRHGHLEKDGYVYNFHQGQGHVRGLLRRCTEQSYKSNSFTWEAVFDVDAFAKETNKNFFFKGYKFSPTAKQMLLYLSEGNGDAFSTYEFDPHTKTFVKDGFYIPPSKGGNIWLDDDTLLTATKTDENSFTNASYPCHLLKIKRGQTPQEATILATATKEDSFIFPFMFDAPEGQKTGYFIGHTFYTASWYGTDENGDFVKLNIPLHATLKSFWQDEAVLNLREDWVTKNKTYPKGSLVLFNIKTEETTLLWAPSSTAFFEGIQRVKAGFLLLTMENVWNKLTLLTPQKGGTWQQTPLPLPAEGVITLQDGSAFSNEVWVTISNSTTPHSLYACDTLTKTFTLLQKAPQRFDASDMEIRQHFATSKDGTKIPYFLIGKTSVLNKGNAPTLLFGYGGFEVPIQPAYSALTGKAWLEKGGVYAIANIRGGGEFGPAWHQAALKQNRQRCYDDFIAVIEDLIHHKTTTPKRLGIYGGSNGGLLVGAVMTQRPELFNAVVCAVPLLDMLNYHTLLAGASWVAEYGNADIPEERQWLEAYSPLQNLKEGVKYPKILMKTDRHDDRVHPWHARVFAHRLMELGCPLFYYENTTGGGHAGAGDNKQLAFTTALQFTYLLQQLADE